ncbi:MAG: YegP family protein [Ignavibacteriaceae bacterium]|jgi:uncharacterized protein YegP (UPF0339 family)
MPNNKFQTYKDKGGKFRFRLLAGNSQVILQSEGYNSKATCKNAIDSVKRNGTNKGRFALNQAKNGKHYFNLIAVNKEVIGSSQMYASRATARKGIASIMRNAKSPVEDLA